MKKVILTSLLILIFSCRNNSEKKISTTASNDKCTDSCCNKKLVCKLTSKEMQNRKQTVIDKLKNEMVEKKELEMGYAFKFNYNDSTIDELVSFIKTEKECCDFFTFNLSVGSEKNFAWLELTGPKGVKEFLKDEIGM